MPYSRAPENLGLVGKQDLRDEILANGLFVNCRVELAGNETGPKTRDKRLNDILCGEEIFTGLI